MSVRSMLRTTREVWRPVVTQDDMGGRSLSLAKVGTVRCKVDIPGVQERESADQWTARHTHSVFLAPTADVRRGDELRGGGLTLRVLAVYGPSRPDYRKALCSADQPEG